ncbi:transmembrane amino acid transporter protein-domain-containing protein [Boeremia exigua]|uniref:transmembrane amino acid transporter protein-domain-containing protein n=1 Tax=Boeremia exigua TaxID=749465 RepID=UPI001E8D38A6|nr:transmembrane amino acid transporter protein-domain-containing protein [Boeremia exigua]KAH6612403.1 transmembrane amino acid transporter protein-domain-containing protein [Boeremia exigua]
MPQPEEGSFGSSNDYPRGSEKGQALADRKERSEPGHSGAYDNQTGEVHDPYGGKKLGMVRTALIFFTNQVGIVITMGVLATYTAYILIQFYRRYPSIRDVVDVARIMGGKPLEILVGVAHVLNLCLICASANVTLSIALNTMTEHALCTVGFIGIPMIMCWLLCMPRSLNFAGWFGIPATISIFTAVLIVVIALAVNGPDYEAVANGGSGYWGEPTNQPLQMRLGPNPGATMNQQFESVLNVAFAYAGNQAFITVMCEMRNPSKDYTPAIIWLNAIGVPMYVITACVVYHLAGQYVVSPALGSAPGIASKAAYGILFPTLLGSGLVFGHTGIKYMYNVVMDKMIKTRHRLTDNTPLTWGVWLGLGTLFWVVAFVLANAIPAFGSILGISSALFVTWFTFGMANAQWIFLNWGQQFINWKKTSLALFNWFMIFASAFLTVFGLYTSISDLSARVQDPDDPLNVFTCANNALF